MIQFIEIENFQMHKHLRLDFVDGVNVLQGESDVGKSCIIRALLWVVTNRPTGFNFRHWDCKKKESVKVTIGIQTIDGLRTIKRIRSESVNEYWLDDQVFKAMGASVPEPILQVLNMQDFNIQTQYLPHFLLSVSAGEVARALNAACDLSIIDKTIKEISSIASKAKMDAKYAEKETVEINQKLTELDWLVDAKERLKVLAEDIQKNSKRRQKIENLQKLLNQIEDLQNSLKCKQESVRCLNNLEQVGNLVASFSKLKIQADNLRVLLNNILATKTQLIEHQKKQIPYDKIQQASKIVKNLNTNKNEYLLLRNMIGKMQATQIELEKSKIFYKESRQALKELWKNIGYCPLCNQPKED